MLKAQKMSFDAIMKGSKIKFKVNYVTQDRGTSYAINVCSSWSSSKTCNEASCVCSILHLWFFKSRDISNHSSCLLN